MSRQILLVDDEPILLNSLRLFLEDAGHQVFTARNGTVALDIIRDQQLDAVVCDQYMPGMDGVELCQRIRQNPEWQNIQFILLTGDLGATAYYRNLGVGIDHCFAKPFDPGKLLAILANGREGQT